MKVDISRDTFNPLKAFTRVVMQQGRLQLDADFNEQVDILLGLTRQLAVDAFGPWWAPAVGDGFRIESADANGVTIKPGVYYVDGIRVESAPPHPPPPRGEQGKDKQYAP
jgi:hypothetical protein